MENENLQRTPTAPRTAPVLAGMWLWLSLLGVLLLAFTFLFLVDNDSVGPETGVSIGQLVENEQDYVGDEVTVSARVDNLISANAFALNAPGLGEEVLVVSSQGFEAQGGGADQFLFDTNQAVEVTGTVREFDINALEQELGIDLDESELERYQGAPVIVAESVNPIDVAETEGL